VHVFEYQCDWALLSDAVDEREETSGYVVHERGLFSLSGESKEKGKLFDRRFGLGCVGESPDELAQALMRLLLRFTIPDSSQFGDDIDRPLKKSDGSYTYFASDIAYYYDKYLRGFREMIDVLGADHGGYVKRMQAAVKAITGGEGGLDVKICQLVRLLRAGEPVTIVTWGDSVTGWLPTPR